MILISKSNIKFEDYLEKLIKNQLWSSSLYSKNSLRYYYQLSADAGKVIEDKSFLLVVDNTPVIAFLGATLHDKNRTDLLAYEIPCISIEDKKKLTKKITKVFYQELESRLTNVNGLIRFREYLINDHLSNLAMYLMDQTAIAK